MIPSIKLCATLFWKKTNPKNSTDSTIRNTLRKCFLGYLLIALVKIMLASSYVLPTMMVLSCKDIPNLSKVNCVRQQNICITNISKQPPNKGFQLCGNNFLYQFSYCSLFWIVCSLQFSQIRLSKFSTFLPSSSLKPRNAAIAKPSVTTKTRT